jgi:hypothetical protein
MSNVEVEYSCEDSVFVMDSDGDVYIKTEVSGNVVYILLGDGGSVWSEKEVSNFQIKPLPIGSVIKITV